MDRLVITDPDGDQIELRPVHGFSVVNLFVACGSGNDFGACRLTLEQAKAVRDYIDKFLSTYGDQHA